MILIPKNKSTYRAMEEGIAFVQDFLPSGTLMFLLEEFYQSIFIIDNLNSYYLWLVIGNNYNEVANGILPESIS